MQEPTTLIKSEPNEVAVIGMAGRFPGAANLQQFWRNLCDGVESITEFTDQELASSGVDPAVMSNPHYVKSGSVLEGAELFDASFFGFAPLEATLIDPQYRVFLECAWEALEDAGHSPRKFSGSIGVYAGARTNSYLSLVNSSLSDLGSRDLAAVLNGSSYLTAGVSYKLGLTGPSVRVDTACSTSLVAIHLGCQALLNGECDMVLAGGVSLAIPQRTGYLYRDQSLLSQDGHCRVFDADASGTVFTKGAGIVVLRRLTDALNDGDRIDAVVKGSAINNDGALKAGFTAPSVDGQIRAISEALAVSSVDPRTVGYVETHGTGTRLGDPIEISALTEAYGAYGYDEQYCAIGSVKSNIGHSGSAAGVAGMIKAILAVKHGVIPPSLNFNHPNPNIDFQRSPFFVNTALSGWPLQGSSNRAAVSSFGVGGTNAHLILEEHREDRTKKSPRPSQTIAVSARTERGLSEATRNLAEHLESNGQLSLADVAFTLQTGRTDFEHRAAVVCESSTEAVERLRDRSGWMVSAVEPEQAAVPVTFMFPGQGSQHVNMGRDLYESETVFRDALDRCSDLLGSSVDLDLIETLYAEAGLSKSNESPIHHTSTAQPALFSIEYSLAQMWMAWGVQPDSMIGHSVGEYTAACLAGVISLEDALRLVAMRGAAMGRMPAGAMLSVGLEEGEVKALITDELAIAAVNTPESVVVSGPTDAISKFQSVLEDRGALSRPLQASHAFHSPMMDPILSKFRSEVETIDLKPPRIPYLSNLTGTWISDYQSTDPNYWVEHLRQTVRFSQGLGTLLDDSVRVFLEVGPGRALTSIAMRHPDRLGQRHIVLSSMRHPQEDKPDYVSTAEALGHLWTSGVGIDWENYHSGEERRRVSLPTYPFERSPHSVEQNHTSARNGPNRLAHQGKLDDSQWFHVPSWRRTSLLPSFERSGESAQQPICMVFAEPDGLGARFVRYLESHGDNVVLVTPAERYGRLTERHYKIKADDPAGYDSLIEELASHDGPKRIVHFWSGGLNGGDRNEDSKETLAQTQMMGFHSLLRIARAIGRRDEAMAVDMLVVSTGVHEVIGEATSHPERSLILGPCKVIPREYPNVTCRNVDVAVQTSGASEEVWLLTQLRSEIHSAPSAAPIAYRKRHRWESAIVPTQLSSAARGIEKLKQNGVYLITGGLGGIGLTLAEHLAKRVRARLVLTGRSEFPERRDWERWFESRDGADKTVRAIRKIQELERAGATVLVLTVDVTDLVDMKRAVAKAEREFGRIDGVIHAAGVPDGALIQGRLPSVDEEVLSPKVQGTLALDECLRDHDLDFLVLCSSLSSVIGPVGQVAYVSANAFLDSFAQAKALAGDHGITSINWDAWSEVGMAADGSTQISSQRAYVDQGIDVGHPLLGRLSSHETNRHTFSSILKAESSWVLSEHRVAGRPTLPGTAYIEIVRAAFQFLTDSGSMELRRVAFLNPLSIDPNESREVMTSLDATGRNGEFEFTIESRPDSGSEVWTKHALGEVRPATSSETAVRDIKLTGQTSVAVASPDRPVPDSRNPLVTTGPRWPRPRKFLGPDQGAALVELPIEFAADLDEYKVHPGLLDVALSATSIERDGAYLPIYYSRIVVWGPLSRSVVSEVRPTADLSRSGETLTYDAMVTDERGGRLVDVTGYTLRKVDREDVLTHSRNDREENTDGYEHTASRRNRASFGLTQSEGVDIFSRVIATGFPQVVVSCQDIATRLREPSSSSDTGVRFYSSESSSDVHAPSHDTGDSRGWDVAEENDLESRLAEIWEELLGVDQVGAEDDFFSLGGHSFIAVQLITRIRTIYGIEVPLGSVFENPTISEFGDYVRTVLVKATEEALSQI